MQNDEVHMKAQAEARYYLEEKERGRDKRSRKVAIAILVSSFLILIALVAE